MLLGAFMCPLLKRIILFFCLRIGLVFNVNPRKISRETMPIEDATTAESTILDTVWESVTPYLRAIGVLEPEVKPLDGVNIFLGSGLMDVTIASNKQLWLILSGKKFRTILEFSKEYQLQPLFEVQKLLLDDKKNEGNLMNSRQGS